MYTHNLEAGQEHIWYEAVTPEVETTTDLSKLVGSILQDKNELDVTELEITGERKNRLSDMTNDEKMYHEFNGKERVFKISNYEGHDFYFAFTKDHHNNRKGLKKGDIFIGYWMDKEGWSDTFKDEIQERLDELKVFVRDAFYQAKDMHNNVESTVKLIIDEVERYKIRGVEVSGLPRYNDLKKGELLVQVSVPCDRPILAHFAGDEFYVYSDRNNLYISTYFSLYSGSRLTEEKKNSAEKIARMINQHRYTGVGMAVRQQAEE